MKKWIALLLVLSLAIFAIGCQSAAKQQTTDTTGDTKDWRSSLRDGSGRASRRA